METPLLTAEGILQTVDVPEDFSEFGQWDAAQAVSINAALQYSSFVNLVYPLENLLTEATFNKAWDKLNAVSSQPVIIPIVRLHCFATELCQSIRENYRYSLATC